MEGKGSTFVVRLPLGPSGLADGPDARPKDDSSASRRPMRILVTDDNVDAALTLASLLELYGHDIRVAHDGTQALQIAEQFRPELTFLDIGLPGMSGYDVARKIRQIAGLDQIRIAAISGWGAKEDLARAKDAGFDAHFTKPVAPARLSEFLHTL